MDVITFEQGEGSGRWMRTKNKRYCENAKKSLGSSGLMRQKIGGRWM